MNFFQKKADRNRNRRRPKSSRSSHFVRPLQLESLESRLVLANINLATLGALGVTIYGAEVNDQSGISVSNAGDVNGDGFEDMLIGARYADAAANAKISAGDSYLVFGKPDWSVTQTIDLANLGTDGVTIFGAGAYDYRGPSVSGAGDVSADGFDDLFSGGVEGVAANNTKAGAGKTYLVLGKASWLPRRPSI